ncbi:PREDICTED: VQ motif-containing protein 25-like [Nelumbo nucifera]|uniref:VQ motif-containing protein 25-like n=2 Tax=Nelumbo nucifera TaxID=4432 RepID=A0A1U8AEB5_NELNU|nr:PREDICTED: VQ motif-containing protein 25-like [Nelumbo nucifera]DAD30010.1 TPA_asm: hypothetical protein HUJ06_031478 [Nelumbo nucifera]
MEEKMKRQACKPNAVTPALAMHRDSHVISKFKPKIRIIHIFAPEVIKTDAANFRELVQRLTGKPTDRKSRKDNKSRIMEAKQDQPVQAATELREESQNSSYSYGGSSIKEEEDQEEEMWRCQIPTADFLGGLDFDGFFKGFDVGEFPFLPLSSSNVDVFGETPLS